MEKIYHRKMIQFFRRTLCQFIINLQFLSDSAIFRYTSSVTLALGLRKKIN